MVGSWGDQQLSPSLWPSRWAHPAVPCSTGLPGHKALSLQPAGWPLLADFVLLFFSAVSSFIRLTLISEIRITWSREEMLWKLWIYFQPRENEEQTHMGRIWARFGPVNHQSTGLVQREPGLCTWSCPSPMSLTYSGCMHMHVVLSASVLWLCPTSAK